MIFGRARNVSKYFLPAQKFFLLINPHEVRTGRSVREVHNMVVAYRAAVMGVSRKLTSNPVGFGAMHSIVLELAVSVHIRIMIQNR